MTSRKDKERFVFGLEKGSRDSGVCGGVRERVEEESTCDGVGGGGGVTRTSEGLYEGRGPGSVDDTGTDPVKGGVEPI